VNCVGAGPAGVHTTRHSFPELATPIRGTPYFSDTKMSSRLINPYFHWRAGCWKLQTSRENTVTLRLDNRMLRRCKILRAESSANYKSRLVRADQLQEENNMNGVTSRARRCPLRNIAPGIGTVVIDGLVFASIAPLQAATFTCARGRRPLPDRRD
jgi:hypothetical protein